MPFCWGQCACVVISGPQTAILGHELGTICQEARRNKTEVQVHDDFKTILLVLVYKLISFLCERNLCLFDLLLFRVSIIWS